MRIGFGAIHYAPPAHMGALLGLGDVCQTGPYGTLPNGTPLCIDTTTGNEVACNDPLCATGAPTVTGPADQGTAVLGPPPADNITLGCGASSSETYVYQTAANLIAMPSSCGSTPIAQCLTNAAVSACGESGGGASFGCPPMAGCDAASIAAMVAKYAPLVAPAYNQYQQYGGYAPPPTTPSGGGGTPYVPPVSQLPSGGSGAGAGSGTGAGSGAGAGSSAGAGAGSSGSGAVATSTNWLTETSIDSIPNWALVAGSVALLMIVMTMVKK